MRTHLSKIVDEYIIGYETLKHLKNNAVIFGSARTTKDDPNYLLAYRLARALGVLGYNVITGGGPGIMEAANHGCYKTNSKSVGLNLELPFEDTHNDYQDISLNHHSFSTRKAMFFKNTDMYFVMPGGDGTLDELFEARTLMLTEKIRMAPIVLVGSEFWNPLLDWMRAVPLKHGTISDNSFDMMYVADTITEALTMAGVYDDERISA